ncbi:MAG: N-6 DNA methylase, partial [Bacteroidetes bacterium GWC2_33_15]
MKKEVFKYLNSITSMEPLSVDRLLVSSFVEINKLSCIKNKFIKGYIVDVDEKDNYEHLRNLVYIIQNHKNNLDFEDLIQLFEFVISPIDKIVTGAVYTPQKIRDFIVSKSFSSQSPITNTCKIADISCGCGGFLYSAAKQLKVLTNLSFSEIYKNNLFGLDIQNYSITRTKLLLTLLAISEGEDSESFDFNLFIGNALSFNWQNNTSNFKGFNIILGNPPYVCSRNISTESRALLDKWEVCKSGHPDLYIPFFQIGIENLSPRGILGYITMNTFYKSINGRALREYFQNKKYSFKIIDFGNSQVFDSKSTYTCICFIENLQSSFLEFAKGNANALLDNVCYNKVEYTKLTALKGWNLNKKDLLDKIENSGISFGELYKTRNGIATLKNNIYIFNPIKENEDYYYLQNGKVYEIEKGICKDIINPNKFTQAESVDSIKKKVIFPYNFINEKVKLLDEQFIKREFPKAYIYLSDKKRILSTRDKGKGNYENWYAYGRNQSLEKLKYKLFFPHITPSTPNFTIDSDENLLFYNGLAVITENELELQFLKKLMSSRLFWTYIKLSSKPYGSGYYSLSRNYIKNFGVYNFSEDEKAFIIKTNKKSELDNFIEDKYN